MSVTSATLRKLAMLNLSAEQMAGVLDLLADQQEVEEVRLSAQRERKARQRAIARDSHGTVTVRGVDSPFPDKEIPPTPPKETTPIQVPPSPPKGGSSPVAFEAFWVEYPHKVGKADASKAFDRAIRRTDVQTLMAGLRRYAGKTDDRPWCNPSTWLNQDRWTDEPAMVLPTARGSPPLRGLEAVAARLRRDIENEQRQNGTAGLDLQDDERLPLLTGPRH